MILENIANFKILQEPNVQLWLSENVFGRFTTLKRIIVGQGTLMFGLIGMGLLLSGLFIANKLLKNSTIVEKIKEKIMWSPVFRSQIQMFFPTCIATFSYFRYIGIQEDLGDLPGNLIKLVIILGLPIYARRILKASFETKTLLNDEAYKKKFGTLYQNMRTNRDSIWQVTPIFCAKRILLAFCTVYIFVLPLTCSYVYGFASLFSIGYYLNNMPMERKLFNFMEILNEGLIYFTFIFTFIFTDWIDIEERYTMGYVFISVVVVVLLINIACVVWDIFKTV